MNRFLRTGAWCLAAAAMLAGGQDAAAKVLFTENFDYAAGDLRGNGGWYYLGTQESNPIQVGAAALTYPGYQDEAKGKAVTIANLSNQDQDLACPWGEPVTSGTVYMSALINVTEATDKVYFLTFGGAGNAGYTERKTLGWEGCRIFASKGDTEGTYKLGFSKNGANPVYASADMPFGQTVLVVLAVEIVEGEKNDVTSLWINPVTDGTRPEATASQSDAADPNATRGIGAVQLRQGTTASKTGPKVTVDAIRVADSWADLFGKTGGGDDPQPPVTGDAVITAPASVDFGTVWQYSQGTATLSVKATGLTGDITVSSSTGEVKPAVTTIPMAEAMSESGYELTLNYTASSAELNGALTLKAEGAEDVTVAYNAQVTPATPFANLLQLPEMSPELLYYYQGRATITYVDARNNRAYGQGMFGDGAVFDFSMCEENVLAAIKAGNRYTKFYGMVGEPELGVRPFFVFATAPLTPTATDVTVTPAEVSLAELARDPETYLNRLVTVADIDFGTAAGSNFGAAAVAVTSGDAKGSVRAFAGTDVIGSAVPAKATSVTGISTSASAAVVSVRALADIVAVNTPVDEPKIEVDTKTLIDASKYQKVGESVAFGKVTVTYANLEKPATMYIGGAQRDMFTMDAEQIPAGSGTLEVNITYIPTATGRHSATLVIDATPTELSQTIRFSAKAYDPEKLPVITADASGLTHFTAQVGATQEQSFTYTTKDLLDYGSVKVESTPAGFRLNTASLLMNTETGKVTVTFAPQAPGEYSAVITLSADMAEPVSFTVTGTATGDTPVEEKQGDAFTDAAFDTSDARTYVNFDFQDLESLSNKPFKAYGGWTNVALTGTRAWWGYKEADGNVAVKVTAYDSKATESSLAQMLLISPALNFKDAAQHLLTFRVKGLLLTDGMFDNLQILYIDPAAPDQPVNVTAQARVRRAEATGTPLDNVWVQDLGIGVPRSKDAAGAWSEFVVDFKNQELADKFFIAFAYTSLRGTDTTVSYLVDDFSWGRTDVKFIRIDKQQLVINGFVDRETESEVVTVEGLNLSAPISLKVTGAHASRFTLSNEVLPAEGGTFTVKYNGGEEGTHTGYVELSADGAPVSAILLNGSTTSGVDDITADGNASALVDVYNLQGVRVMHGVTEAEALRTLAPGLYLIGNRKVQVR